MDNPTPARRYDCGKTVDYAHEYRRMCCAIHCDECGLKNHPCNIVGATNTPEQIQRIIDVTQRWSDAHPEEAPNA